MPIAHQIQFVNPNDSSQEVQQGEEDHRPPQTSHSAQLHYWGEDHPWVIINSFCNFHFLETYNALSDYLVVQTIMFDCLKHHRESQNW